MIHKTISEIRLIVQNERDVVCAGNVFGSDDNKLVPGNVAVEGDVCDLSARHWTAYRGAVKHVGKRKIIDIQRLAGDFLASLFAGDGFADGMSISHGFNGFLTDLVL